VAHPARGGAVAGRRSDVWGPQDGGHLPGDPQAAASPVDVRAPPGVGADQTMRPSGPFVPASSGAKAALGPQSGGLRFVEALMTVVATLKQQHRNVLDYLTAACEAALCGEQAPSLLQPLTSSQRACVRRLTRLPR